MHSDVVIRFAFYAVDVEESGIGARRASRVLLILVSTDLCSPMMISICLSIDVFAALMLISPIGVTRSFLILIDCFRRVVILTSPLCAKLPFFFDLSVSVMSLNYLRWCVMLSDQVSVAIIYYVILSG